MQPKMVDCVDSDSYEDDLLVDLVYNKHDDTTDMKGLTFASYQYDLNDKAIVSVLKFDRSKISVEGNDFKIFCNNKPFFC